MEVVRDLTEDCVGVDVALECGGLEAPLNACAKAVRRQGTVVQTGLHMRPASIDAMLWALKDIALEATWCYPVTVWPRIARLIASGAFPVEKAITATALPPVTPRIPPPCARPAGRLKFLCRNRRTSERRWPFWPATAPATSPPTAPPTVPMSRAGNSTGRRDGMAGQLTVIAHLRAWNGQIDATRAFLTGLIAPTQAEPGCVEY